MMFYKIKYIPVLLGIILLCSCKGRRYRASSNGMAATINAGETFYVKKTKAIERNDIVVFKFFGNDYSSPMEVPYTFKQHWEDRVYRLIAVSGDTVEIKNDDVYVNNKPIRFPAGVVFPYDIYTRLPIDDDLHEEHKDDVMMDRSGDTIIYRLKLTKEEVEYYREEIKDIIKIVRNSFPFIFAGDTAYARPSADLSWNSYNYGPLHIPSPGETIMVTRDNFKLYHNIPGITLGKNKIMEKLYFVMGDNRYSAEDSRFIGFIPHSNMYGIVK